MIPGAAHPLPKPPPSRGRGYYDDAISFPPPRWGRAREGGTFPTHSVFKIKVGQS
jgi:hypothetical protein